jgi:hypothetical protein
MEQEYDFSTGQRGKYARHFAEGTNLVLLEGDVAAMFPDSRSVNRALRKLAEIIRESGSGPRSPAPTAKR